MKYLWLVEVSSDGKTWDCDDWYFSRKVAREMRRFAVKTRRWEYARIVKFVRAA